MKCLSLLLLFSFAQLGNALIVPFSSELVKTEGNHYSGMERIYPADQQVLDLSTDCWIWHDGKNLYLHWEMQIDESFEPGAYATRDDVQTSDYVRLQLKTIENEDFAYYFAAYPRGNAFDAVRTENLQIDKAWNSFYDCSSSYSESLWTVKMIIPFRDLRFDGEPPYNWSFGLARQVQATNSSYSNPYAPLTNRSPSQYFDSFAPLVINEKIENPKNHYIMPYFYKSYDFLTEEDSFDPRHLGLNLVYRPSTNSSLKIAFNPDFTEVPVDEERDSHNDKYPPQLGENRILFTEDLNAFGVSSSQFYSRNIMQPSYAVKYTASGRNWSLGFLSARDKETSQDGVVVNPADDYNIIAFKPQWGSFNSQLSLLSRTNFESDYYNFLIYAAPTYEFSPNWAMQSRMALSADKQYRGDFQYGYLAAVTSNQKLFLDIMSSVTASAISDNYAPGMGSFSAQNNIDQYAGSVSLDYNKHLQNSTLRALGLSTNHETTFARTGDHDVKSSSTNANLNLDFTSRLNFNLSANVGSDRMPMNNKLLNWSNYNVNLSLNRWRLISGYLSYSQNKSLLYTILDPQKSYPVKCYSAGINGFLGPVISYIFRNDHIVWSDLPDADAYISGVRGDDEYDITNLDLELTFSNNLKIVTGVRYNNYEMYGFSQHLGYFATLHYSIDAYTKLYAGFKSTEDEYLNNPQKTSQTAWFKLSRTF